MSAWTWFKQSQLRRKYPRAYVELVLDDPPKPRRARRDDDDPKQLGDRFARFLDKQR